jgi:carbamoyltransferase
MKMANGTPRRAISEVMRQAGVAPTDVDLIVIAQNALRYRPDPEPWDGWFQKSDRLGNRWLYDLGSTLAPLAGHAPIAWRAYHSIKRFSSRDRLSKLPALLRDHYGVTAPVRFYDHHFCHAASAYYTSNFKDALVITLNGGGDGRSGSVYLGANGRLQPLGSVDSFNSLGNLYSYVTVLCGFKAEKHEGKITGLAALGKPKYAEILAQVVRYEDPGNIRYTTPMYHRSALRRLTHRLPANFDRADLAASAQKVVEDIGTRYIRYWLRKTKARNLAVAGGVFSNVKFNQRVNELPEVDGLFIHPAMDDSGLAVGGALAAAADSVDSDPASFVKRLPDVYFGPAFSNEAIRGAIQEAGLVGHAEHRQDIHDHIAHLLSEGVVVARFAGRMEYGPRALGHRSIMYQTTDASVNHWLNEDLQRTEFMPFAPATLEEHTQACYLGLDTALDSARFMTVACECTPEMQQTSPGVTHVDGTARPQIVDPETAPDFHRILTAYYKLTGIPSLINTSFNRHEEPIVCTPEDAIEAFQEGRLDYLAIGDWIIKNPVPSPRSLAGSSVHAERAAPSREAAPLRAEG